MLVILLYRALLKSGSMDGQPENVAPFGDDILPKVERALTSISDLWYIDSRTTATTDTHGSKRTTDQRWTRMGAGTLRPYGDPGIDGLHVYDTRLTTDMLTVTTNEMTRDTAN